MITLLYGKRGLGKLDEVTKLCLAEDSGDARVILTPHNISTSEGFAIINVQSLSDVLLSLRDIAKDVTSIIIHDIDTIAYASFITEDNMNAIELSNILTRIVMGLNKIDVPAYITGGEKIESHGSYDKTGAYIASEIKVVVDLPRPLSNIIERYADRVWRMYVKSDEDNTIDIWTQPTSTTNTFSKVKTSKVVTPDSQEKPKPKKKSKPKPKKEEQQKTEEPKKSDDTTMTWDDAKKIYNKSANKFNAIKDAERIYKKIVVERQDKESIIAAVKSSTRYTAPKKKKIVSFINAIAKANGDNT